MFKLALIFLSIFIHFAYAADVTCVGKQLLAINDENFTILERKVQFLIKEYFGVHASALSLENNGKTIIIKFECGELTPYITNGPYGEDIYKLELIYFNWLRNDYITHDILPMELHIAFKNIKYKAFEVAVKKSFGITVWSFKYSSTFQPEPNALSADVFDALKFIREPNTNRTLKFPQHILPSLFQMTEFSSKYYMYQGRLTSMLYNCSGDVIWLEFPTTASIDAKAFENIGNLSSFNKKPLMEQFHDSPPSNFPIYQNVEDNLNYETDIFNATFVGIEETQNGVEINYKKCLSKLMIFGMFIVVMML